jgi:hypothetical protein
VSKGESMTTRCRTLTVILDGEYRVDDVENIINAITMLRGVYEVKIGEITANYLAIRIAKLELEKKLLEILKD